MLGPEYLGDRQHLTVLVTEIITKWSATEVLLGQLLARIFHTSPVAAMEMYLGISSALQQHNALDRAAEAALSADHRDLYTAIRRLARGCEVERNKFAHHIPGVIVTDPGVILLVEPDAVLRSDVAFFAAMQQLKAGIRDISLRGIKRTEVLGYREKDLRNLVERIDRVRTFIVNLWLSLDTSDPDANTHRDTLVSQPEIAAQLKLLREARQSAT